MDVPRILIVDGEPDLAAINAQVLRASGYDVSVAGNGRAARVLMEATRPHLVLLDPDIPDMCGLQLCREFRNSAHTPGLSILILTARCEMRDLLAGFEAGADDYLVKPFDVAELHARIRALLRRQIGALLPARPGLELCPDRRQVRYGGKTITLSKLQFRLLSYLVQQNGVPAPAEHILKEIWNDGSPNDPTSLVRYHIGELRRRLEDDPHNPKIICVSQGLGYFIAVPVLSDGERS